MPTTPPSITALPAPPDPSDRSTYNARAYPWSVAQQTLATEFGAVADNVFSNATEAVNAAALAVPAAAAAEAASNAVLWVSGKTYAAGDVVWSPINALSYRRKTAGAGTTDPSADSANWASLAGGVPSLLRVARTSNTMLAAADKGKLIDITSGTFTQTFDAVATLRDGWWCYLRNSGSGYITLEPDGAEQIDGMATIVLIPGDECIVQCSGLALHTITLDSPIGTHCVTVHSGNGYGSINTKIRRFTTTMVNVGTAISYADSASSGAAFTINATGMYCVTYTEDGWGTHQVGISVNSVQLTTAISSINAAHRLVVGGITGSGSTPGSVTRVVKLSAGDIVRPHTDGGAGSTTAVTSFAIEKVGSV